MIRSIWNLLSFGALTFGTAALCLPVVLVAPVRGIFAAGRAWSFLAFRATGVEVETHGFEHARGGPFLVMANHTSHTDVVALYRTLPFPVRFVAKKELAYIPIFGWVLALGAAIIIDRKDRAAALRSLARARRSLQRGQSVLFFPEGTRTPPGVLGELKKGPFHLAVETGAPILPIGIEGSGAVLPAGDWRLAPGRIVLRMGAPIETRGFTESAEDRAALAARVAEALSQLMRKPA